MKSILITTEYRGVFFAQVGEAADLSKRTLTDLKNCRMAIRFGTDRGVMQLAETGPTESSRISAPADIHVIHGVTAVFDVTDEAAAKWLND
ncbi:MAG: hypothetical protein AAFX78_18540 [Cyanobacteria bacterium J06638_20]